MLLLVAQFRRLLVLFEFEYDKANCLHMFCNDVFSFSFVFLFFYI